MDHLFLHNSTDVWKEAGQIINSGRIIIKAIEEYSQTFEQLERRKEKAIQGGYFTNKEYEEEELLRIALIFLAAENQQRIEFWTDKLIKGYVKPQERTNTKQLATFVHTSFEYTYYLGQHTLDLSRYIQFINNHLPNTETGKEEIQVRA